MGAIQQIKAELKENIIKYLQGVTKENYTTSYDGLIELACSYRGKQITKKEVMEIITQIAREDELNGAREDVLFELGDRVSGHCMSSLVIDWW